MVAPSAPTHLRSRRRHEQKIKKAATTKLCFMLLSAVAVISMVMFFGSFSSNPNRNLRSKFHNMVEHYELIGYGPSHPRAAFTLVATNDLSDPLESMSKAIRSILSTTDRNRILVICAVFQKGVLTKEETIRVELELDKLDQGATTHWHGMTRHKHEGNQKGDETDEHQHGHKIKAMFLDSSSVAESRRDAASYIQLLIKNHEVANFKSEQENVITVFLRPDSEIETERWIDSVTHGLIGTDDKKTSNAISFAASSTETISQGESKSANLELKPIKSHASKEALALTQGQSYPTPIVEGAVTAMTLETFLNFPIQDSALDSHFASDLEMSFNLWMCADGIDIVDGLRAKTTLGLLQHKDKAGTSPSSVARLAYTWMGGKKQEIGRQVLQIMEDGGVTLKHLEDEGKLLGLPDSMLLKSCRTFKWYTQDVNVAMDKELAQLEPIGEDKKSDGGEVADDAGEIPSKPLSEINTQIISTAKMVDLEFVDASGGHVEDPHRGAMDENGLFGYVHDATALRKNPPTFTLIKEQAQCDKQDGTMKMLTKKVFVDFAAHQAAERQAETSGKPRAKIFCLVYTIEKFHDRIPPIRESWGQKCDGFMVGSTKTDKELGTVNIPHEGEEEYNNIWQKVRSMWSYIYDNYYEDYDWFHIGGDDLYVLVENLRLYLESEEIQLAANGGQRLPTGKETKQLPLFLGRRFKEQGNEMRIFNSGGSGYTMNKATLKALITDAFPTCMPHLHTFAEDVMVAQCLRNKLEVFPFDTKDENGGERYMPFGPQHHLNYKIPKNVNSDWYANYSIDIKEGLDHCAARSVAFHYIKGPMMQRMHAILYGHCV
jgi:glycoprotein-N-acetylgalactosamine 3-beta-galactosyltransferase